MAEDVFAQPGLEFVFEVSVAVGERQRIGATGQGDARGYGPILGGEISGPRLAGSVVGGSGADLPHYRPDGVFEFDARYLLRADDGTLIVLHNRGYRHGPADLMQRLDRGEEVEPHLYYHRFSPRFEVPIGTHDWLARTVFIGVGKRGALRSRFRYYAVT